MQRPERPECGIKNCRRTGSANPGSGISCPLRCYAHGPFVPRHGRIVCGQRHWGNGHNGVPDSPTLTNTPRSEWVTLDSLPYRLCHGIVGNLYGNVPLITLPDAIGGVVDRVVEHTNQTQGIPVSDVRRSKRKGMECSEKSGRYLKNTKAHLLCHRASAIVFYPVSSLAAAAEEAPIGPLLKTMVRGPPIPNNAKHGRVNSRGCQRLQFLEEPPSSSGTGFWLALPNITRDVTMAASVQQLPSDTLFPNSVDRVLEGCHMQSLVNTALAPVPPRAVILDRACIRLTREAHVF